MTGTFKVTNTLAAYLVPVILCAVAPVFSRDVNKRLKVSLILASILLVSVMIFTFSRAGWLGLIAGLVFLLICSRNIRAASIPLLLFLSVLLAVPALKDRVTAHGDAQRVRLFSASAGMIRENPVIGKGVGTYMDRFSQRYPTERPSYAHNSFLQVWAETGVLGFLSLAGFLSLLLVKGARAARRGADFMLMGLVSGIFGFLAHSFFDNHFYTLQLSFLFWSLAGLCSSQCVNTYREREDFEKIEEVDLSGKKADDILASINIS
jgi:O-antigen ligase